jgi:hypothetical protein
MICTLLVIFIIYQIFIFRVNLYPDSIVKINEIDMINSMKSKNNSMLYPDIKTNIGQKRKGIRLFENIGNTFGDNCNPDTLPLDNENTTVGVRKMIRDAALLEKYNKRMSIKSSETPKILECTETVSDMQSADSDVEYNEVIVKKRRI